MDPTLHPFCVIVALEWSNVVLCAQFCESHVNCIDTRFHLCIELILVILHRLTDEMHSTKQQLIVVCIQSLKTENSPQYLLLNLLLLLMKSTTCSDSILNDISEIPVYLSHSEDRRVLWNLCKLI